MRVAGYAVRGAGFELSVADCVVRVAVDGQKGSMYHIPGSDDRGLKPDDRPVISFSVVRRATRNSQRATHVLKPETLA